MRVIFTKIFVISFCAIALSACGSTKTTTADARTGSFVQRYTMTDANGVVFGTVLMDPVNGGSILDAQGRGFARIVPDAQMTAALQ